MTLSREQKLKRMSIRRCDVENCKRRVTHTYGDSDGQWINQCDVHYFNSGYGDTE
jgi:hypothetical protein